MNSTELENAWSALPHASFNELSGIRASGVPPACRIYIAVDSTRRRQLLIALPDGSGELVIRGMRGLDVLTENLRIGDSPEARYIQLICLNPVHHTTFAGLCADILNASLADPTGVRSATKRCLDRWRTFWMVDPAGLSTEAMLGLFGELWFLRRWIGEITLSKLEHWTGPTGARHDFQWGDCSIEVKTAVAGPNKSPVHFITNLDQLDDPATGDLFVFSLHLADDSLAKNTLNGLIEQIAFTLQTSPDVSSLFWERLALAGYNQAQADHYSRSFRVVSEDLYRVSAGFPRMTRRTLGSGLPSGIEGVSYYLAIASCASWRIAKSPDDHAAAFLKTRA